MVTDMDKKLSTLDKEKKRWRTSVNVVQIAVAAPGVVMLSADIFVTHYISEMR